MKKNRKLGIFFDMKLNQNNVKYMSLYLANNVKQYSISKQCEKRVFELSIKTTPLQF